VQNVMFDNRRNAGKLQLVTKPLRNQGEAVRMKAAAKGLYAKSSSADEPIPVSMRE
jgi:hypothetical protein